MRVRKCPICNNLSVRVRGFINYDVSEFRLECTHCTYRTHKHIGYEEAINEWNNKTAQDLANEDMQLTCLECGVKYAVHYITRPVIDTRDDHFPYASTCYDESGYIIVCPKCNRQYGTSLYTTELEAIINANREA